MKLALPAKAVVACAAVTLVAPAWAGMFDKHTREVQLEVDHVADRPLIVETRNGAVAVRKSDGDTVRIEAKLRSRSRERIDAAQVVASRTAEGALEVTVVWPGERKPEDGCSFEILIPDVSRSAIDTANGGIEIAGLGGEAHLDTSNGPITVHEHVGPVIADTSNGAITIVTASGAITADTTNGSIKIQGATGDVVADTSNGNIVIALADDAQGTIEADTSNGSISIEVGQSFVGVMEVETSNGRITTSGAAEHVQTRLDRRETEGEVFFGGGGPRSSASTSNGSIKINVRN